MEKIQGHCPAHFNVFSKPSDEDKNVLVYKVAGCLSHDDTHPIEEKYKRKSKKTDKEISTLLGIGIPKNVIKDRYFSISKDQGERVDKPIISKDIDRIQRRDHPNNVHVAWQNRTGQGMTWQGMTIKFLTIPDVSVCIAKMAVAAP